MEFPMMFMISYINMQDDPQAQARFDAAVQIMRPWANALSKNGVWIVQNPRQNAAQIRDTLKTMINPGDRLFVARISRNWAGTGMNASFPEWMMSQDFGTFADVEQGKPKA
jgi:hypothetical protein